MKNSIRTFIAGTSALVLSLGFALPAAAKDVTGTVNTATQGTVQVGGASGNANLGINVGGSAETGASSTTSGEGSADINATMETTAALDVTPLLITRVDVDAGTVQATMTSPSEVRTHADLSGYVAGQMKADSNISSVSAASDSVEMSYKQHAKLFGFIPVTVDAKATVDGSGNVSVSYPWYAFLMATNKSDLEADIQSRVSTDLNVAVSSSGQASAESAARLSADEQARVVAAVKAVMQAELNPTSSASASVQ